MAIAKEPEERWLEVVKNIIEAIKKMSPQGKWKEGR